MVFGILLFFSFLVYYFSYTSQRSKFRENLLIQAQNTAILLINVEEIDSTLLKKIQQTTRSFAKEEIALTDSLNRIIYSNQIDELTEEIIFNYSGNQAMVYFTVGQKDGVSYRHQSNNKVYHVFVLAFDSYRDENLRQLRVILFWSILFCIWLSVTSSFFFSKSAMKPISDIIANVKGINSLKLNSRLDEGRRKDEIEQLAVTFIQMLSGLEIVFRSQDGFVSRASHELRTPLAIMIAESDYILSRPRKQEEYEDHISGLVTDLRKLNQLLNGLLELAHLNRDNRILFSDVRIDEPVFNAIQDVKAKYPGRKIMPKIDYTENSDDLMIKGNSGLLEIAFKNLIDNACKFSQDDIDVVIMYLENHLKVSVSDCGMGIPEKEIPQIFKPFSRATNVRYIGGFGIGLSIVEKIIELHSAEVKVKSAEGVGSCFEIIFRK